MNFQSTGDVEAWRNDAQAAALRQRFLKALAFSVVLHAAVLLYGHSLPQPPKAIQPLMATLRAVESPTPSPSVEEPEPPKEVRPAAPRPKPAVRRELLRMPATDETLRRFQAPAPPLEARPVEAALETAKPPDASAGNAAPFVAAPPSASAPPSAGLDPNAMRRYKLALASTARRFKVYPRLAQERGWVGTAEIRVTVYADARPPQVQLAKSSGFSVLDNQAREMLVQAVQNTALPEVLRGREFSEVLPVKFDLTSE